jgi:L-fucose mutarotase
MLKGLDPYLTPDLLRALAAMGHGDRVALVDRNFPAYAAGAPVIQLPRSTVIGVLEAILQVFPIDASQGDPVIHMLTDAGVPSSAVEVVRAILDAAEQRHVECQGVPRNGNDGFYARSRDVSVVVQTGETKPFVNFLLPKGVI